MAFRALFLIKARHYYTAGSSVKPSLADVIQKFFQSTEPQQVQNDLFSLYSEAQIGRLALLSRSELVHRALLADSLSHVASHLYEDIVAEWGDDPTKWVLPVNVRSSVGDLLALLLSSEQHDHTGNAAVEATGAHTECTRHKR